MIGVTPQPLSTFVMIETAKRALSTDAVVFEDNNVLRTHRPGIAGSHPAIKVRQNGQLIHGRWSPETCEFKPETV